MKSKAKPTHTRYLNVVTKLFLLRLLVGLAEAPSFPGTAPCLASGGNLSLG